MYLNFENIVMVISGITVFIFLWMKTSVITALTVYTILLWCLTVYVYFIR